MQLIDTRISANDDHTTTVVFAGEGSERVSVRLSAEGLRDEDAILRAKAVMVQLTRFEGPSDGVTTGGALDVDEGETASFDSDAKLKGTVSGLDNPAAPARTGRLFQNGDTDREG